MKIRNVLIPCLVICSLAIGDGDALYKQGAAIFKSNPVQALELFEQAAEADNVSAMVGAGHCYETGTGTKVDYAKAIESAIDGIEKKPDSTDLCFGWRIYNSGI